MVPIDNKRPLKLKIYHKHRQLIGAKAKNPQKITVALLRESPLEKRPRDKAFSQRAIANDEI